MIKKIVVAFMFLFLIIAVFLSVAGVEHVEISTEFMALLKTTNKDLNDFKIAIPDIPQIPRLSNVSGFLVVIDVLISFINGLVQILNFAVSVINIVISVIQFIVILIKNIVSFKDILIESSAGAMLVY